MTEKQLVFYSKVQKWDSDLAIILPDKVIDKLKIKDGTEEIFILDGQTITIKKKSALNKLMAQTTDENKHEQVDWGKSKVKETPINSQIGHKLVMNRCMKKFMVQIFPH